jgi:hypothetical protein
LYPDFIGIGAQRAGTTWLSRNLQVHPQIWMPPIKEVHYFDEKIHDPSNAALRLACRIFGRRVTDRRWRRQVRLRMRRHLKKYSREDFLWDLKYYVGAPGDGWYASLFEPGRGRMIGEITPAYSTLEPSTVARIHEIMPEVKIVFMMRNPIERAWSQAVMGFDKVEDRAINAVAEKELRRHFGGEGSRLRTDYLRTLRNWETFYAQEQIFAGFLEDIYFFPEETLRRLYRFLGVDPSFRPPEPEKKVHSRSEGAMPTGVAAYLARSHREEMERLEERFGGYASFWRFCAERLIEDPPKKKRQLPYPLWESRLWKQWKGSRRISPRSGPLPSVRVEAF